MIKEEYDTPASRYTKNIAQEKREKLAEKMVKGLHEIFVQQMDLILHVCPKNIRFNLSELVQNVEKRNQIKLSRKRHRCR